MWDARYANPLGRTVAAVNDHIDEATLGQRNYKVEAILPGQVASLGTPRFLGAFPRPCRFLIAACLPVYRLTAY
jgi:hypothetical protein